VPALTAKRGRHRDLPLREPLDRVGREPIAAFGRNNSGQ